MNNKMISKDNVHLELEGGNHAALVAIPPCVIQDGFQHGGEKCK